MKANLVSWFVKIWVCSRFSFSAPCTMLAALQALNPGTVGSKCHHMGDRNKSPDFNVRRLLSLPLSTVQHISPNFISFHPHPNLYSFMFPHNAIPLFMTRKFHFDVLQHPINSFLSPRCMKASWSVLHLIKFTSRIGIESTRIVDLTFVQFSCAMFSLDLHCSVT